MSLIVLFYSETDFPFLAVDKEFDEICVNLLIKKQSLFDRFQRCLLRQSMKSDSHESIMLNKLFVTDETNAMKFDREVVAQGIPLDLPPPPKSWQNAINTSINVESEREQISRKRSFLDDNLSDHVTEVKRPPPPIKDEDETEDEEDDSDDDEDDDDDDTNLADDMSEYLGPHDTEHVDINAIYDEITYDQNVVRSSLDFTFCNRSTTNDQWNSSFGKNTTTSTAWRNFNDAEAAVAVDSILSSDGEEEEAVQDISVDLSGLAEQPEAEGVENATFPSTFNELENGLSQQQQTQPETCDPQMQCAIDSILMDVSGQASNSSNPFFVPQDSFGRGYSTSLAGGISAPRSSMSSFGHPLQGQVSDPALDEAVKSILS